MSSAYPSSPPASRTWWSLGPKHSSQHGLERQLSHKSSRYSGLSSIAVALGIKSKKHPVLAIQDPACTPPRPTMSTNVVKTPNRPPSKSVSSTRSQVDSLGPRTPQDTQRDNRQSLLTISDTDPFALVRAISSAPQSPSVADHLCIFSNSSNPDVISKNTEPFLERISYASSSSQSNVHGSDLSPLSPSIPDLTKKPKSKKSTCSLHRKQSLISGDQSLETAWESLTLGNNSKAGSSTALTLDKNRSSQPAVSPTPRPPTRARGMTDSGQRQESATLTTPSSSSSYTPSGLSTRTVIRQPSASRIGSPPSAPPKQELPPPPSVQDHRVKDNELEPTVPVSTASASSSSLSFASSISSQKDILFNQHYSPRKKEGVSSERSISTRGAGSVLDTSHRSSPSPTAHTLKKAVSHQSLGRRPPPPTSSVAVPLPELPTPSKAPHKQRSFHHPKFPLPPLSPIRSSTSSGSQTSTHMTDSQSNAEQRRGSAGGFSLPVRKRLFSAGSNSRRPSTSPSISPEDDSQSVFSVRSVPDRSIGTTVLKPLCQPLSPNPNSSFWDEVSLLDQMPSSPRTHEYTPQQIMSPAEMAKLEANADDPSTLNTSNRQRGFSVLSTFTTASIVSDEGSGTSAAEDFSPPDTTSIHAVANTIMSRSTSLVQKDLSAPPRLGPRPSTSQVSMTTPIVSEWSSPISSPPSPSMTSLPPPPRRARPRATFVDDDSNFPSLPPPPGRRSVRPKISVEKVLRRRSIMRKPSFLEIDDDSDKDTDTESPGEPLSRSFLDLARESFDTTRSISE